VMRTIPFNMNGIFDQIRLVNYKKSI